MRFFIEKGFADFWHVLDNTKLQIPEAQFRGPRAKEYAQEHADRLNREVLPRFFTQVDEFCDSCFRVYDRSENSDFIATFYNDLGTARQDAEAYAHSLNLIHGNVTNPRDPEC